MKTFLYALLVAFSVGSSAYPVDENGNRLITMPEKVRCQAKGDLTLFVYQNRDKFTETEIFERFDKTWNETWKKVPSIQTATYVDMQRIIRDAYRTNAKGEFRQECCTKTIEDDTTIQEMKSCLFQGF